MKSKISKLALGVICISSSLYFDETSISDVSKEQTFVSSNFSLLQNLHWGLSNASADTEYYLIIGEPDPFDPWDDFPPWDGDPNPGNDGGDHGGGDGGGNEEPNVEYSNCMRDAFDGIAPCTADIVQFADEWKVDCTASLGGLATFFGILSGRVGGLIGTYFGYTCASLAAEAKEVAPMHCENLADAEREECSRRFP